ncbi:MAG: hypothetical protein WD492_03950 [Alkalispirochaeta sp.]
MKKTVVIIASMVALVTVMASAQTWNGRGPGMMGDPSGTYGGYGPMHGGRHGMVLDDVEEATVAGRIQLQEGELPTISSGGTTYSLHIPWVLTEELSISDGQQVTVEGYVTTARSFDLIGEETILRVRAMESDGTRVVLPSQGADRSSFRGSASPHSSTRGRW